MFDTLLYAKRLEAAGMTRDQAEAQVNVIAEMVVDGVATKQDLALQQLATQKEFAEVRSEMREEFAAVRSEMHREFAGVRSEMHGEFAAVRSEIQTALHRQTIQTGVMIAASTTLTISVLMFFR